MAGLVAEKTWGKVKLTGVIRQAATDNTNRELMYLIKYGLIRNYDNSGVGGSGSWLVVGSSDSVAASMDGTDRWTDWTKLVWGIGIHSWIILKQPGINAAAQGFQICIDCLRSSAQTEYCTVVVSYGAGFTGGDISNRPTATDEVVLLNNLQWGASPTNYYWRVVVCKTSDGECTRVYMSYNHTPYVMWILDKPKNPHPNWPTPFIGKIGILPTYANLHNAAGIYALMEGAVYSCFATCEGRSVGALTEEASFGRPDDGGNWLVLPIGISINSSGVIGELGSVRDLWFISSAFPDYEYLRGSGNPYEFVVFKDILQAYDGTPFTL